MAATAKKPWTKRLGFLGFLLFLMVFIAALFFGIDQLCVNDANRRLPYYPGATRVKEDHNGLRLRGMGNGLEVLLTQDSQETVEAWFEQRQIELLNSGRNRGVNNLGHWLEPRPEGEGLNIYYLSQCVM